MDLFRHLLAVVERSAPTAEYSNFEALLCLLLALWLITRLRSQNAALEDIARNSMERKRALYSAPHEFAPVRVHDFHWLDEHRYEETQRRMEEAGFQCFGDVENLSLSAAEPKLRTAVRELASGDGVVSVSFRQIALRGCSRFLARLRVGNGDGHVLEMSTEFSDGSFLSTSNHSPTDAECMAPGIERIQIPAGTPIEEAVLIHRRRVSEIVTQRPGIVPVPARTARAMRDSAARAHALRCAEFAKSAGVELREGVGMPWLDYFPDTYALARKFTTMRGNVS